MSATAGEAVPPHHAPQIEWRRWDPAAFAAAAAQDRPVLLHLAAAWCHWCRVMDETTYADPEVVAMIRAEFVPVRVDVDRHPHVRDRYLAGGWPTVAFLTPAGDRLWAEAAVEPERLLRVGRGVLKGWREGRDDLMREVERERHAASARRRRGFTGIVRRETADDVLAALQDSADPGDGGFGEPPRFPAPDAVELLMVAGLGLRNPDWLGMAERHLDGMLAGELLDREEGGFYRYALARDWLDPQPEKLLTVNAGLVRAFALGANLFGRQDWRDAVERTVAWAEAALRLPSGLWAASQDADPEYFALDAEARTRRAAPGRDDALYTDANASWIRALAEAGARLARGDWIERAESALGVLLALAVTRDDGLLHVPGDANAGAVAGLLVDHVELARAAMAVAQATGEDRGLDAARDIVAEMERLLLGDDGVFRDAEEVAGAPAPLRRRDSPPDLNGSAARLLLDLGLITGDRSYRAMAERILATLAPGVARYGAQVAGFALAVEEYFEPPLMLVLVGSREQTVELRLAAGGAPVPDRRVWTVPPGAAAGVIQPPAEPVPAAYVCVGGTCSAAATDAPALERLVSERLAGRRSESRA